MAVKDWERGVGEVRNRVLGLAQARVTATFRALGQVAQLVEQRTENPRVGGSIPSLATQFTTNDLRKGAALFTSAALFMREG